MADAGNCPSEAAPHRLAGLYCQHRARWKWRGAIPGTLSEDNLGHVRVGRGHPRRKHKVGSHRLSNGRFDSSFGAASGGVGDRATLKGHSRSGYISTAKFGACGTPELCRGGFRGGTPDNPHRAGEIPCRAGDVESS